MQGGCDSFLSDSLGHPEASREAVHALEPWAQWARGHARAVRWGPRGSHIPGAEGDTTTT